MAWQYSNPLNGALLAANGGQSDTIGLGSTSLYKPYFSSYDPLFTSRYQPRTNFFDRRSPPSIFDDLELELEVDDSILSPTRYRPSLFNNQPAYVPSYFNSLKTSLNNAGNSSYDSLAIENKTNKINFYSDQLNDFNANTTNNNTIKSDKNKEKPSKQSQETSTKFIQQTNQDNLKKPNNRFKKNSTNNNNNNNNTSKIPANKKQTNTLKNHSVNEFQSQQPSPPSQQKLQVQQQNYFNDKSTPNFQRLFEPIPFQETPTIQNNINSVESSANLSISNHNNQKLRFLQYQQRLLQQQEMNKNESLSELEIMKLKQQQDKQQLMQAIATNANKEKIAMQYQPFFQDHHLNKQYSETSIPSTNADPLNSNSPTPPLGFDHRMPRVNFDKQKPANNNQTKKNNQAFYYKLNEKLEDQTEPGSYLNTMRDTRIREQRLTKDKYTSQDYKQYQKNYGFGRDFLPFETETKKEKLEKARKREEYSKMIKERNTILMDGGYTQHPKYNPSMYANMPIDVPKRSFGPPNHQNELDHNNKQGKRVVKMN